MVAYRDELNGCILNDELKLPVQRVKNDQYIYQLDDIHMNVIII